MSREIRVATHRIVLEKDDVVVNYFGGSPTEQEMIDIVNAVVELSSGKPIFLGIDLGLVETLSAPVRRVIGDSSTRIGYKAIGMFRASFHIRVVAKLVNSALGMFRKDPFPQEFFDTHGQALAWFDELRAQSVKASA